MKLADVFHGPFLLGVIFTQFLTASFHRKLATVSNSFKFTNKSIVFLILLSPFLHFPKPGWSCMFPFTFLHPVRGIFIFDIYLTFDCFQSVKMILELSFQGHSTW